MIINDSTLMIIAVVLSLGLALGIGVILKQKKVYDSVKQIFSVCFIAFLALFLACEWLIRIPIKTIEVIEYLPNHQSYTHKTNLVYGNNVVHTWEGEEISIKDLGLKAGKTYAINISDTDMLFYPISYSPSEGIFLFNKNKDRSLPESVLLRVGEYAEIDAQPDFWFRNPPKQIPTNKRFLGQLWDSMFNVNYIKWTVIPYNEPLN